MLAPGFDKSVASKAAVARSIEFMLGELEKNELLGPGPKRGYDVRGWAHAYALEFFLLVERKHIAGNCHTARESETGIMEHVYGPHIFNTSKQEDSQSKKVGLPKP